MAGGKRKGAGRKPVPEKKPSITVTIRKDQKEWLKATKRKGWFAKFIEINIDREMN